MKLPDEGGNKPRNVIGINSAHSVMCKASAEQSPQQFVSTDLKVPGHFRKLVARVPTLNGA